MEIKVLVARSKDGQITSYVAVQDTQEDFNLTYEASSVSKDSMKFVGQLMAPEAAATLYQEWIESDTLKSKQSLAKHLKLGATLETHKLTHPKFNLNWDYEVVCESKELVLLYFTEDHKKEWAVLEVGRDNALFSGFYTKDFQKAKENFIKRLRSNV